MRSCPRSCRPSRESSSSVGDINIANRRVLGPPLVAPEAYGVQLETPRSAPLALSEITSRSSCGPVRATVGGVRMGFGPRCARRVSVGLPARDARGELISRPLFLFFSGKVDSSVDARHRLAMARTIDPPAPGRRSCNPTRLYDLPHPGARRRQRARRRGLQERLGIPASRLASSAHARRRRSRDAGAPGHRRRYWRANCPPS